MVFSIKILKNYVFYCVFGEKYWNTICFIAFSLNNVEKPCVLLCFRSNMLLFECVLLCFRSHMWNKPDKTTQKSCFLIKQLHFYWESLCGSTNNANKWERNKNKKNNKQKHTHDVLYQKMQFLNMRCFATKHPEPRDTRIFWEFRCCGMWGYFVLVCACSGSVFCHFASFSSKVSLCT